jgi:hypothetical protein
MIRKESSLLASVLRKRIGARAGSVTVARSLQSVPKRKVWHSVSIDAKPLSCEAALDLRKTRYLSKDAPALPLKECSKRAACPCTYKHHEDRRAKPRRAAETGSSSTGKKRDSERRVSRGRRDDDQQ